MLKVLKVDLEFTGGFPVFCESNLELHQIVKLTGGHAFILTFGRLQCDCTMDTSHLIFATIV